MAPFIKYCGNHSVNDLRMTVNSHADYIGVIFSRRSKRYVHPDKVAEWLDKHPLQQHQRLVGVFVNPTITDVLEALVKVKLDVIQCHGAEMPHQILEIKRTVQLPVWKVIHHNDKAIKLMRASRGYTDGFIIDNKKGTQLGGTGETFDWSHIPKYIEEAKRQGVLCFIAGGINPSNISTLLSYHPDGIDLASGIEYEHMKDKKLINMLEKKVVMTYAEQS